MRWHQAWRVVFVFPMLLVACATSPPVEDYTLARAAMDAARDADAPKYAPSLWFKAEESYRVGQLSYRDRRFATARTQFLNARDLAEQAENAARLRRFQSGETIP